MRALCAVSVSLVSLGMAAESISLLISPVLVRCSTVTFVIRWLASVSCTCMGPYWVFTTEPVTVRAAWLVPPLPPGAERDGVPAFGAWRSVADGACAGGAGVPEATVAAGWDLNDSSAARSEE